MEKRFFALVYFSLLILMAAPLSSGLTAKATQGSLEVSAEVIVGPPVIDVSDPVNGTYLKSTGLPLKFFKYDTSFLFYNIDNGQNISLVGNTTFDTSEGQHTLKLYVSNSFSTEIDEVIFAINSSKLIINNSVYTGSTKGNSTLFLDFSFEQLSEGLDEVILENTNFGKISFLEKVNITDDSGASDNLIDLDRFVNISFNRISIDSENLNNFNKSAEITLRGLTFSDPRILRDGSICPSSICTLISYSAGTLLFNVTHFSTFSAEETPTISGGGGGGGEGGGRGPSEEEKPEKEEEAPKEKEVKEKPAPELCTEKWECAEWTACDGGLQTRECKEVNECGTSEKMPSDKRYCVSVGKYSVTLGSLAALAIAIFLAIIAVLTHIVRLMKKRNTHDDLIKLVEKGNVLLGKGDLKSANIFYREVKGGLDKKGKSLSDDEYREVYKRALKLYEKIKRHSSQ